MNTEMWNLFANVEMILFGLDAYQPVQNVQTLAVYIKHTIICLTRSHIWLSTQNIAQLPRHIKIRTVKDASYRARNVYMVSFLGTELIIAFQTSILNFTEIFVFASITDGC